MQFDSFPASLNSDLESVLENHLGILKSDLVTNFFLRETCQYWEGRVKVNKIIKISPPGLWHHLIRGGEEILVSVRTQQLDTTKLRFQTLCQALVTTEGAESALPVAFDRAVAFLDREPDLPEDLKREDVIVRLLEVRPSFFHAMTFHSSNTLLWTMPLTYPRHFDRIFERRRFWRTKELVSELKKAPSFYGVGPSPAAAGMS